MRAPDPRSRLAIVVVVYLAFAILTHLAIAEGLSAPLGAVLSLIPLALFALWAVRRSGRPAAAYLAAILVALGTWLGWGNLQRHFPDVFFVEHAAGNLFLAFLFGRTLVAGREPLCTRFARIFHEGLPPKVGEYTRRLTLAWTLFFVGMLAASCVLYFGGFLAAWSLFASVATPLLLATMFSVEYAIRSRVFPNIQRVGVLGGIRAFSRHIASARTEAPR